jgi:hypothetical protein
VLEKQAYDQQ